MLSHRSRCLFAVAAMLLAVLSTGESSAAEPAAGPREFLQAYVAAFNNKQLEAVQQKWGEDCTYLDRETGERVSGRSAVCADIAAVWKSDPEVRLAGKVDRVKLVTADVARIEGLSVVTRDGVEQQATGFAALLVKRDAGWQFDTLEEFAAPADTGPAAALRELDWLVGTWVDDSDGVTIKTTFRWSSTGSFLLRSFSAETADGLSQSGTQIIGWDPRAEQVRSWTFHDDGAFGDGVWIKSGSDWLVKSSQTLADGNSASGTYVFSAGDQNQVEVELIGHTIGGVPQPAGKAVSMIREKAGASTKTVDENPKPAGN